MGTHYFFATGTGTSSFLKGTSPTLVNVKHIGAPKNPFEGAAAQKKF
jgi:hypothetical protein